MDFKVNINETVKVKLTDVGIGILKEQHDELDRKIKANNRKGLGEFKLQLDDEGYTRFQLWSFMNAFGEYMTLGSEMPFDSEVIITKGKAI